jgi:hypothetical protein
MRRSALTPVILCQLTWVREKILLIAMRLLLIVCAALVLSGCRGKRQSEPPSGRAGGFDEFPATTAAGKSKKLIVTPEKGLIGKVAMVNPTARFVVLNFPVGHLPGLEQRLNLYRAGLKVGEVKVTGPQYDDNVVADIIAGESEVGDQVRDQ